MKKNQRSLHRVRQVLPTVPRVRLPIEKLPAFAPGDGNPSFGRAYVTRSAVLNWAETVTGDTDAAHARAPRKEGPFTLSAGPVVGIYDFQGFPPNTPGIQRRGLSDPRNRVTVTLGECPGGPSEDQDLTLGVEFSCPMWGTQVARGPITIEQALSFEEAVRAVFEAARQTGLLPIASKYRRRK